MGLKKVPQASSLSSSAIVCENLLSPPQEYVHCKNFFMFWSINLLFICFIFSESAQMSRSAIEDFSRKLSSVQEICGDADGVGRCNHFYSYALSSFIKCLIDMMIISAIFRPANAPMVESISTLMKAKPIRRHVYNRGLFRSDPRLPVLVGQSRHRLKVTRGH